MRVVLRSLTSRALRLAAVLTTAAQLVMLVAPFADARAGQSAGAHVERAGLQLHHAHVEAACPGCAAQQLTGPPTGRPADPVLQRRAAVPAGARLRPVAHATRHANLSRAPPSTSS